MWQQTAFIIAFCLLQKIFALLLSKRIALFLSFKKLFFSFLLLLNVWVWFKFEITQDSPFRKFLEIYFLMLCVDCDTHMPDVYEGQKRALDALGLEFRIVVNCHVNAGNGTQNLCKGLKCFRLLSQLICPQEFPFDIYGQKSRVDAVYIFLLALNFWKISVHRHLLWGAEAALRLTDELKAVLCIYIALRAKK